MKKNGIFLSFLILFLVTVFLNVTCKQNIGLGPQVDVVPPAGQILYPDAGETPIRGSFVLKGTASDDDGIQSIIVVFENIETKERSRAYEAAGYTKGSTSALWTVNVANESTGTEAAPHELVKIYPIPDGEYTAILTVTDNGGKTSTFTKNYKIDNTPPVFIVSRPSTIINESAVPSLSDQADRYGAIFSVVGQAGEKNTVEKLNVLVPGIEPMTNMFVGNNINAQVAVYNAAAPTNALYDLQAQDIAKPIKGGLYLYDNAREYTGGNASGEGNKADWYYLWDAVYTDVIAKGYTPEVISDYFAGKKGSNKDDHNKKIKELRGDTVALATLKTAMIKMSEKRSTFKLEPSKSPGFKVIGVKNLPGSSLSVSQASLILFKSGSETAFSVELIRNKDNTPLVSGNTLGAYKASNIEIVLLKWNGTGTAEESFKTGANLEEKPLLKFSQLTAADMSRITVENGNLRIQCMFDNDWGEGYYAVSVKGTDTVTDESHTFQAYDDSNSVNGGFYIINFLSTGSGTRIRPVRIEGFKNQNFDIFAYITDLEPGNAYYNIGAEATENPAKKLTRPDSVGQPTRYTATLDISGLTEDKEYTLHFLAKPNSGSGDTDKITFTVDKTAPTVALTYPESTIAQAGEVSFTGTISDSGAGVKASATKFLIAKKSAGTVTESTPGWQSMATSTAGSWNFKYNFSTMTNPSEYGDASTSNPNYYDIPIYILAEDNIGNKKVHKLTMILNPDGRKPVVRILSPVNNAVLGGTIQIFGTTSVAIGSPADIGEAYIQFSKDGTFTNTNSTDGTFGGVDWYNGGNGRVVDDTTANGAVQWMQTINQTGLFNPSGDKWTVYFRVRAKNKNPSVNEFGEWSEKIKIEIDKSAPTIGSPEAVKIVSTAPSVSLDYVPRMWIGANMELTGSLYDESGIKKLEISGDLKNGTTYNLSQADTAGWITEDTAHAPTSSESGTAKNYKLKIPLNLAELKNEAKTKGEFSVKIAITEDTGNNLKSEREFTFRFDTENPSGGFGDMVYVANGTFSTTSINDSGLANTIRSNPVGLKMLVGDKIVEITGLSGLTSNTVNFAPDLTSAGKYNYAVYKPDVLVKAVSADIWVVRGVANDNGSGVKSVTAKLEVGSASQSVTMTELDPLNKIYRQLDGLCKWEGHINLSSIPDGKGKLTYTVTDNSGNVFSAQEDVRVKNKALRVTTLTLSTDIGGTQSTFKNTDTNNALVETIDPNSDATVTFTSKQFAFKSLTDSKIKVDFTGGQGQVKYTLKYNGTVLNGHNMKDISSGNTIALSSGNLNTIGNSTGGNTKDLLLELWDSAEGCSATGSAPLTKSSFAAVTIKTIFDAVDGTRPTVVILPFHWNGENNNSLYQNSRTNGHVEIKETGNSQVSGKVTLRGFAYDNIELKEITAKLPNSTDLTVTATRQSDGTWKSDKKMFDTDGETPKDGAELTVETLGADYLGYYISWQLDWDTEKATVAAAAKEITVTAKDGVNKTSTGTDGTDMPTKNTVTRGKEEEAEGAVFAGTKPGQFVMFKKGETQYLTRITSINGNKVTLKNNVPVNATDAYIYGYKANKTKTAVDVVPYISGLTTALSKLGGNDPDLYARTALGRYPVRDKETITVKGFNLTGAACTVGGSSEKTLTGTTSPWTLELPADAKSGALTATVNSIAAINNMNNNSKPYNKAKKTASNDKLTDDLYLDIWQFNSEAAKPERGIITEPVMRINPANGIIGFAFANGPDYFSMSNGQTNSYEKWQKNYDDYANVDFVYDSEGRSHGVVVGRDINSSAQHAGKFTYFTSKWGPGDISSQGANYDGFKGRRLEAIGQQGSINGGSNYILDKTRIQHPSLATVSKPGTTESGKPRLYLAYYDGINDQIRFKYGTNDKSWSNWHSTTANNFGVFIDQETGSAVTAYKQDNVGIVAGKYKSGSGIADTGNTTGTYLSLGLVAGSDAASDIAVLIWFDETNRMLKYTYKKNPQNNNHAAQDGSGNGTWKKPVDVFDKTNVGEYCKIAVDKAGGIHIAAYDADNADLKYAYLSKYDAASFKTATVDSYGITGTHISLDVAYTASGADGKPVPYIGYYSASAGRSKLAYLVDAATGVSGSAQGTDDSGYFTGKWEVSVVPTASRVQQDNINVGVWKTAAGVITTSVPGIGNSDTDSGTVYGNGTANPVLGYAIKVAMNGYIETAQKK